MWSHGSPMLQKWTNSFFSLPSVRVCFELKLCWHVEWLTVCRGFCHWCTKKHISHWNFVYLCVCVCEPPLPASVKTKRQPGEYFIPPGCLLSVLHGNADQCKRAGMNSIIRPPLTCSVRERSCRMRGSRLQRFLAGATTVHTHLPSGSEAVLYTCQPSSAPGYSPCTQTAPVSEGADHSVQSSIIKSHAACISSRAVLFVGTPCLFREMRGVEPFTHWISLLFFNMHLVC